MATKKVAVGVLIIILVGLATNAKNVRSQMSYITGQGQSVIATKPVVVNRFSTTKSRNGNASIASCLEARNDTVPVSIYHNLPKPFINLGFPKMGTTTLHEFFKCGGLVSNHLKCGRASGCAKCIKDSVEAGLPPLSKCKTKADMYAQIDNGGYFPQIELLEELVHGVPNATFFLTFRSMEKWYHSITHWPPRKNGPHMDARWKKFNITGSPSNERESNSEEFSDWYCNHVKRVRQIVAQNPSHNLVEVDIEDPGIGQRMEDTFGIDKSCWGHTNVNAIIHPDLNESEVLLSKAFGENGHVIESQAMDASSQETVIDEDDDDDTEDRNEEVKSQNDLLTESSSNYNDVATANCLKARNDTVPTSLYRNLTKPFINLGFPKMGTTTLHEFFKCGGLDSAHTTCGNGGCAACIKDSVKAGLPPLSKCKKKLDVIAQIDNGGYFPQIELLEELVHGVPNATFFLTFRSMEKWYQSIKHWPPRINGPHMDDRWKKSNITGSPSNERESNPEEFSDWYCNHVKRVRQIVAQNPSHTLVEIDIEDPGIGQRMEDIFGIDKSCWGHTNVNAIIHPDLNESQVVLAKPVFAKKRKKPNEQGKKYSRMKT